jgi:AcrR family transcriptional regulator
MAVTYARIVADIRARIESGELPPGARVPSTRRLVADYGVAMATATKALSALRQAGLARPVPGVGTVGADPAPAARAAPRPHRPPPAGTGVGTDELVRAAIELADAEGLAGVSMRRVATRLGIATMSTYRHVSSREDLVNRMLDAVFAEHLPPAVPPVGWRARAEASARALWAACQCHPWLASALSVTRPQAVPNGMAHTEFLLAGLDGHALDLDARLHVAVTIILFVRGVALAIEPELRAVQDSGLSDEEWMTAQKPTMQRAIPDETALPHLVAAMNTEIDMTLDSLFEFGLQRLLDGLDTYLRHR